MKFKIYRDIDTIRLRKVVLELWNKDELVERTRLFLGPCFIGRLRRRKAGMLKRAAIFLSESGLA